MRDPIDYIDGATWVRTWRRAGAALEALRIQELQRVSATEFVRATADVFEAGRRAWPPRLTSGLVEQQRLFSRLPR